MERMGQHHWRQQEVGRLVHWEDSVLFVARSWDCHNHGDFGSCHEGHHRHYRSSVAIMISSLKDVMLIGVDMYDLPLHRPCLRLPASLC